MLGSISNLKHNVYYTYLYETKNQINHVMNPQLNEIFKNDLDNLNQTNKLILNKMSLYSLYQYLKKIKKLNFILNEKFIKMYKKNFSSKTYSLCH